MVNNEEFADRIKKLLAFYNLSATQFADKINVQRSSISHLLSGRNKPSLDFVIKVVKKFNEVDLYWLLNGKGVFPKQEDSLPNKAIITALPLESTDPLKMEPKVETEPLLAKKTASVKGKSIDHIIIFYNDGSFKKYEAV
ncbi:MAG: transcriptional regulator [Flavobacteriales bacterium CG03_land_8_20_14_0_80_35_15]|nr:helix-turn-helix transcriptional regulator [Zetaproteobacteria bacterium]OIO09421.1 MAG: transcriptional regulator [Flavobacteriaceae bacterium CG1_02_35_72]PIV18098.1 MAG: transcriptional regulator [Flavobacteriales bacterium CG03_land_8_20_14_0_80_35_15]PIX07827.1 MAG: transcriptional regulator [Flavobacteriales bacterium CG_4_8_14_3_um_filter_35_10]PJA05392.1 MAG: transcriptional regulator [Flavobacteriales bacterium CG_4_10_14_0_2_um_filter_35_18]